MQEFLALLDIAKRDVASLRHKIWGFVIGPRINAAGRMESMRIGIECLLASRSRNSLSNCTAAQSTECRTSSKLNRDETTSDQTLTACAATGADSLPAALVMF